MLLQIRLERDWYWFAHSDQRKLIPIYDISTHKTGWWCSYRSPGTWLPTKEIDDV